MANRVGGVGYDYSTHHPRRVILFLMLSITFCVPCLLNTRRPCEPQAPGPSKGQTDVMRPAEWRRPAAAELNTVTGPAAVFTTRRRPRQAPEETRKANTAFPDGTGCRGQAHKSQVTSHKSQVTSREPDQRALAVIEAEPRRGAPLSVIIGWTLGVAKCNNADILI